MRVYTEEINRLFNQAIEQYEKASRSRLGDVNNAVFFRKFTEYVNKHTGSNLNDATVYKQVYLRLRGSNSAEIGLSLSYLNAFCQLVNKSDYSKTFSVVTNDDSEVPEFPYDPYIPCFPATPAVRINVQGFKDVWVKDESLNPTGTHKDRLAWEIYLFYQRRISEQVESGERVVIPRLSIISSGNAAVSIQHLLLKHGLPDLKVIMDKSTPKPIVEQLRRMGCELFLHDLEKKELKRNDVLAITNNKNGYDLTDGNDIADIKMTFYDWLSYEVLNLNPQHLFIPYGTGDLYKNILEIFTHELKTRYPSKRFFGNKSLLTKCNFFGASTKKKNSKMRMLYTPYNSYEENDIKNLLEDGHVGKHSRIYEVEERFVDAAMRIASNNKIECEPSGAAGIALFLQMRSKGELNPTEKYVIINTGKCRRDMI